MICVGRWPLTAITIGVGWTRVSNCESLASNIRIARPYRQFYQTLLVAKMCQRAILHVDKTLEDVVHEGRCNLADKICAVYNVPSGPEDPVARSEASCPQNALSARAPVCFH